MPELNLYKDGISGVYAKVKVELGLNADFSAECDAVEETVRGLADKGRIRYIHISDIHAGPERLGESGRQCMIAVAEMARRLRVDFVLLTGDIIAGTGGNATVWQGTLLDIREFFADCGCPVSHQQVAPAGSNGYFYVDLPHKKVRVININCSDLTEEQRLERGGQNYMVVSQAQLDWLGNEALAVPDGWRCICASHFVPVAGLAIGGRISNATELYAVLEAHADKIIAFNAGHNHVSANYVDGNGLRFITANASGGRVVTMSECQAGYGISGVSAAARAAAPTGAMVFDICIVNADGTVTRVRWGAKDDLFKDS